MSHYKANLRDLEFNLFEANPVTGYLDAFGGMDEDTARMVLREVERMAVGPWGASFVSTDRHDLELVDGEVVLPDELKASIDAYREAGWGRLSMPAELDGAGSPPSLTWATVELLTGAQPTAYLYASGELMARVLFEEGNEAQQKIAAYMLDRNWGGTMVLTEAAAGSDVGAGTTKATQIEGDLYSIEGSKRFITSGEFDHAENIVHLVLARPEGAGPGTKGLSLFMVPKFAINDDGSLGERNGAYATSIEHKMGIKGSTTCEMTFGANEPAYGWLVGSKHDGIRQMFRVIEHARMMIGTKSAATLSTGYLNALEYAKERKQGADLIEATNKEAPRVEIIRHPDVRRMLMTQKAYAEGLRALVMYTAWVQDQIMLNPEDDNLERLNDLLLPMVKGYSSEKAYELLATSLQVFGGSGFTMDYPIEQYIRDAKIDTVYEGTTGIQAMDLFFRKIAKDQGATLTRMAGQITEFVKGGGDEDVLAAERELLGKGLDDTQGLLGVLVGHLMASMQERSEIYKSGLHLNALLESLSEVTIAWLLLRHAEVAHAALATAEGDDVAFYEGKIASARFFVRHALPKIANRRAAAEAEDGALMEMPDASF